MSFSAADSFPEIDLDEFQVVKGDMFQVSYRRQAITLSIWNDEISFSKAAIEALHGCERVRIEINPSNRIHVFTNALREIGEPSRICFLIGENGHSLLMIPYRKRDFRSHHVPRDVYNGCDSMEISSMKLCRIIAFIHKWDVRMSYRVPGKIIPDEQMVIFYLDRAAIINIMRKNKHRTLNSDRETDAEE